MKNKVAPPFRQVEFDILYNEGVSRESELIDLGVLHGFVEKTGAWYSYSGDRLGQGKENVRLYLKDNPDLAAELESKIRAEAIPTSKPLETAVVDAELETEA